MSEVPKGQVKQERSGRWVLGMAADQERAFAELVAGLRAKRPWYVTWWTTAKRKPMGAISLFIVVGLWAMALFAPLIAPYGPNDTLVGPPYSPPNSSFLFGTDAAGRDVFSRIVWGSRLSLTISIFSVVTGTIAGSIWGAVSGYFMGKVDLIMQRITDAMLCLPNLLLLMALVGVMGTELFQVFVALTIINIPAGGRIVRSAVISSRENVYVEAARALGASEWRILFRHVLPNVAAPIIVLVSIALGTNLLAQSSLSFLGLVSSSYPDWGGMLSGGARKYLERMPWLALAPGAAVSIAVLAYNMLGDALRDILDPRLRGSR
jgi:peptide/nickel transport system permease protein